VSDPFYRVAPSGVAREQLEAALAHAEARGEKPDVLKAARWAWEEMQRTPHEFGESRSFLPNAKLHRRVVIVGPLRFDFGIHDDSRTVFVVRIGWTKK
jgi:hypothetical protein